MCYPMYYRNKNHARYVAAVIVTGVSLGVLDVIIEFSLSTPVPEVLGCAAAGCFMSFKFRVYWGCSNMVSMLFTRVCRRWLTERVQK